MPSALRLIAWPFHNGLRGVGMGAGPMRLAADSGVREALEGAGWQVEDDEVPAVDESAAEIARVVELVRRLSSRVGRAVADGAFPLVLAGNCNSCLGTAAGARADSVVWFDAHADFDDPDENTSGFFDVMGLAMLTGRGWKELCATIPGHRPIRESRVVLAGVRDLEGYQRQRLETSAVRSVPGRIEPGRFAGEIGDLAAVSSRAYVHIDLDSLDASVATANEYAAGGGPSLDRLIECVRLCCARLDVVAAAVTAYDPTLERDDRTLGAARRVIEEIAAGVRTS